jgi:hypothetical protein
MSMGTLLACLTAFVYSLHILHLREPKPPPPCRGRRATVIETAIVRHYALGAVFITPLTILLADAADAVRPGSHASLFQARFLDTVLGCLVGLAGGVCLHSPRFRRVVGAPMRKLIPRRMARLR